MGLHGNDKSDDELATAVEAGIGSIVLDSAEEVGRVADAARRAGIVQGVRLSVNSGVHASTHEYLATAREDQKFGVALTQVPTIVAAIRARPELRLLGLHSHIGSQILGVGGFAEAARRLLTVHRLLLQGGPVPELNLGGGFGIAYTADQEAVLDRGARGRDHRHGRCDLRRARHPRPDLALEPGRWIVGPAGVTVYTAGTVKDVELQTDEGPAVRRYVSVDGGMSDNARTALYGAEYEVRSRTASPRRTPCSCGSSASTASRGDVIIQADYLPADAGRGDLLAVPATGAYHHSLASNYNLITRPPVVAVADGAERVLITRETLSDLFARDAGLAEEHGMNSGPQPIRVAVLGAGTVGAEVAHQLLTRSSELEARVGAPLVLAGVAVRDLDAERHPRCRRSCSPRTPRASCSARTSSSS